MKRILAVVVGLAVALIGTVAVAAWLSSGTGNSTVTATTVNQANAPTATRGAGKVDLSWTASTLANGAAVGGYRVVRHSGATTTTVCTVAALTCSDNTPVATAVTYGVIATVGANWKGPESNPTAFTYDNVAPSTTASLGAASGPLNGWYKSAVTVTLTATDAGTGVDHITYTVDGGSPVTVTTSGTAVLPAISSVGSHTITFFAVDGVGNTESTKSTTFQIDPFAPVMSITSPNPVPDWSQGAVTLDFSAVDAGGSGVASTSVGGNVVNSPAFPTTITRSVVISTVGTTNVPYFATDAAGNVETTLNATVKIDGNNPTASIVPAGTTTWIQQATQSVTISGADTAGVAGSNSGVKEIHYTIDGGAEQIVAGATAGFTLGQGDHTVVYWSVDNSGRTSLVTASAQIRVDNIPPTAAITSPASSNTTWRNSGLVSVNYSDATSGVALREYSIDNGATWTTFTGTSFTVPQGTNLVKLRVTDNAGNVTTTVASTVMVDTTAPTVLITSTTGPNWTNNTTVTVSVSDAGGSGLLSREFSTNAGSSWTTFTGTTFTLPAGDYSQIRVRATDNAGTVGSTGDTQIRIDTNSPSITGVTPSSGTNTWAALTTACGGTFVCATSVTDAGGSGVNPSSVTYNLVGQSGSTNAGKCWTGSAWLTGSTCAAPMTAGSGNAYNGGSITAASIGTGQYSLTVTAKDNANNATTTSAVSFTTTASDTTPPTITMTYPTTGSQINNGHWGEGCPSAGVCGTATDNVGVVGPVLYELRYTTPTPDTCWDGSNFTAAACGTYRSTTGTLPVWFVSVAFSKIASGDYEIRIKATDAAGNTNRAGATPSGTPDKTFTN